MGQDASKSPLRFVRSAFLGVNEDGSAQGGIECEEAGCAEVFAFLERAKEDLLSGLPDDTAGAARHALRAEHVKGAGRITLTWLPERIPLGQLLGRFLRAPLAP